MAAMRVLLLIIATLLLLFKVWDFFLHLRSLTVAHFHEQPERLAHSHAFDMSNLSDSLTFAHLS